jgi:antitoxin FitA
VAQFVVRNLEDQVKEKLECRAKRHGRSLQEEVREILHSAARDEAPAGGLGTEIAALFEKKGLTDDIPELRGTIQLPEFKR